MSTPPPSRKAYWIPSVPPMIWAGLLVGLTLWGLANLQWGRGITWDEVEFLRATDWVRQGRVPYRDFFEHHTPLAWFLMAPFEALSHGSGVGPILWMRWLQLPLWGVALWRIHAWMKSDGLPLPGKALGLGCLIGSPFFVFCALEYRIDTLGTVLVILALDRLRSPRTPHLWMAGGLLFLSAMANLRFAPLALATAIADAFISQGDGHWCWQPGRLARIGGGAVLAALPWVLHLVITESARDMWQWCVVANASVSAAVGAARTFWTYLGYPFANLDLPGLLLEAGMVIGGWQVLKQIRRPGFLHLVLLAQIANLAFVAAMKVQYLYHYELSLCLAVPFTARALVWAAEHWDRNRSFAWAGAGVLGISLAMNGSTLSSSNDHATLMFQDRTLKAASRLAPPGSTVLDGCGWLLDSKPAYRFWFLPVLERMLCLQGKAAPYTVGQMAEDPPALVIANTRLENMCEENPEVGLWITTHYLPTAPNLWIPGLSRALGPSGSRWTWAILADGDYRILCHPGLARHPWFFAPFAITMPVPDPSNDLSIEPSSFPNLGLNDLRWSVDGKPVEPLDGFLRLARGHSLTVEHLGPGPIGVILVPRGTGSLFPPPPANITLDYITFNSYWPHP